MFYTTRYVKHTWLLAYWSVQSYRNHIHILISPHSNISRHTTVYRWRDSINLTWKQGTVKYSNSRRIGFHICGQKVVTPWTSHWFLFLFYLSTEAAVLADLLNTLQFKFLRSPRLWKILIVDIKICSQFFFFYYCPHKRWSLIPHPLMR